LFALLIFSRYEKLDISIVDTIVHTSLKVRHIKRKARLLGNLALNGEMEGAAFIV